MNKKLVVVGIGELLWDLFPEGKRLGGAPMNFCYHCQQLGAESYPVSSVGVDELGVEIRDVLALKQVPDQFVAEDTVHPTGTVKVMLDEKGKPSYEICEHVAWDYIPLSESTQLLALKVDAVCFGSLAQRNGVSRKTVPAFLLAMRRDSLKIFDVNLRQDFYSLEIIKESLELCNVLKLSDEELPVLASMFDIGGSVQEQLAAFREIFDLRLIAYTRGADGSLLVAIDEISEHPGCPCEVVNSVGAGDSFTASLCIGLLNERPLNEINEYANRVATFVCSQDGATPLLSEELVKGVKYA